jgi:hypothetical protein
MSRIILPGVARVSQMDHPQQGTGSGGDRCTESVATMIDVTYKIGPSARAGIDPERIMYDFTEWLNKGSNVSGLEDPIWIADWVKQHSGGKISVGAIGPASFEDAKACVERGHIAVLQVNDYSQLRTYDNKDPFQWNPVGKHAGHVLLLLGYDDDYQGFGQTLIVNDPLRGIVGQPCDYSLSSIKAAGLIHLREVNGPPLITSTPTAADSHFIQKDADTWQCVSNGFLLTGALYQQMVGALAHPAAFWQIFGLPVENAHLDADGYQRQRFERCVAHVNPNNPLDFALDKLTPQPPAG